MIKLSKTGAASIGIALVVASAIPAMTVGALNPNANVHAQAATQSTEPGSRASSKLTEVKLKVCQKREKAIDNIMARIADRGQKQLDLFSTIASRVESFYTSKGKTLSNYDALVSDVNAKKDVAKTVVGTIKSDSTNFKCDGTDPKGAAASFKNELKSEISALKDYRTSVKNLIVGVASVQGTSQSSSDNKNSGGQQ